MTCTRRRCQVALSTLLITALMRRGVGYDQLDAAQSAAGELAQEPPSERLGFGRPMSMPRTPRRPSLWTECDDHRNGHDAAIRAHLHVGGVDPQMRLIALDWPGEKGLHLLVDRKRTAEALWPSISRRPTHCSFVAAERVKLNPAPGSLLRARHGADLSG